MADLIHHPDGRKSYQPEWSEAQVQELRRLKRETNLKPAQIGAKLGKSKSAVINKWKREHG